MEENPALPEKVETRGRKKGFITKKKMLGLNTLRRIYNQLGGEQEHLNWLQGHKDWFWEQATLHMLKIAAQQSVNIAVGLEGSQGNKIIFEMHLSGTDQDQIQGFSYPVEVPPK
jgi:hypothetical protein